jgi:hypothetical protein
MHVIIALIIIIRKQNSPKINLCPLNKISTIHALHYTTTNGLRTKYRYVATFGLLEPELSMYSTSLPVKEACTGSSAVAGTICAFSTHTV